MINIEWSWGRGSVYLQDLKCQLWYEWNINANVGWLICSLFRYKINLTSHVSSQPYTNLTFEMALSSSTKRKHKEIEAGEKEPNKVFNCTIDFDLFHCIVCFESISTAVFQVEFIQITTIHYTYISSLICLLNYVFFNLFAVQKQPHCPWIFLGDDYYSIYVNM